jgi:hypothetical protein
MFYYGIQWYSFKASDAVSMHDYTAVEQGRRSVKEYRKFALEGRGIIINGLLSRLPGVTAEVRRHAVFQVLDLPFNLWIEARCLLRSVPIAINLQ